MTDLLLAVVVVGAVIAFGALISVGNERQRRAIDALHQAYKQWAVQDLRIKREKLARDVHVDEPLRWLNKIASKVCVNEPNLKIVEVCEEPPAVICSSGDSNRRIVFSPLSPSEIRQVNRIKRSRLSQYANQNPLKVLPRRATIHEFSVLNSGILFDLELPLAWKGLTGQNVELMEHLWIYHEP